MTEGQFDHLVGTIRNHVSTVRDRQDKIIEVLIDIKVLLERVFSSASPTGSISETQLTELASDQIIFPEKRVVEKIRELKADPDHQNLSESEIRAIAIQHLKEENQILFENLSKTDQVLISEESILAEMERLRKDADFNHLSESDLRESAIRNLSKTDKDKTDDIPF